MAQDPQSDHGHSKSDHGRTHMEIIGHARRRIVQLDVWKYKNNNNNNYYYYYFNTVGSISV